MIGKVYSEVVNGINACMVEVEADVSPGIPFFEMTGNISSNIREAAKRVRTALKNSGIRINPSRIMINISPADIPKDGTHLDLAIAMAILTAFNYVNRENVENAVFIGELSLDGRINRVNAVLPMTINAVNNNISRMFLPCENTAEAGNIMGIQIAGTDSLTGCVEILNNHRKPMKLETVSKPTPHIPLEFLDVKGQSSLKRAAMIAAASMHNMLILGPPGTGKTMTAMRIPDIMPPLTFEESLEISKIYSISGFLNNSNSLIRNRPFRNPNYLISRAAFCGGGNKPTPGEISLAQSGVLFMDEFNLYSREVLEALREPMETGKISISRNRGICEYNADFMLVAAMNPCACGYYPDRTKCKCREIDIKHHLGKISKPILDRIDIFVNAGRVEYEQIKGHTDDIYSTEYMKSRVIAAIDIQKERYGECEFSLNSQIPAPDIGKYCKLQPDAEKILKSAYNKYNLSARSYTRVLKVARTIADVEQHEVITVGDLCEAISYRWTEE